MSDSDLRTSDALARRVCQYSLSEDDIRDAPSYRDINEIYPEIEELFKRETIWLETAATIISVKKVNPHLNWKYIVEHVSKIKSDILKGKGRDFNFVQEVFLDLKNLRMVDKLRLKGFIVAKS